MHPVSSEYTAITHFGIHGGSDHTTHDELMGGRTAITTEALTAYNNLRAFLDLPAARIKDVGRWAFSAGLTNNATASKADVSGVGLWYAMQGAKVYVVEPEDTDVATTVQTAASAIGDAASELRQRRAARAAEAVAVASRSSSSSSTKNAVMLSELQLT